MPDLTLTDQNFEQEVIKKGELVLVDFWSPTCLPCLMLGPVIEEISKDFAGKVKVGKLDVFQNPETAQKYKILGIPTIIIFKGGQIKARATGLRSKRVIVKKLNSLF